MDLEVVVIDIHGEIACESHIHTLSIGTVLTAKTVRIVAHTLSTYHIATRYPFVNVYRV